MSHPPSCPLDLPPHCLAQARCPTSGSGSIMGMDREGCVNVSRWETPTAAPGRLARTRDGQGLQTAAVGRSGRSAWLWFPPRPPRALARSPSSSSRRSWSLPRAGGGNKEVLLPARSSLLRFLALPPGVHTAAIWLSVLWPSPRRLPGLPGRGCLL